MWDARKWVADETMAECITDTVNTTFNEADIMAKLDVFILAIKRTTFCERQNNI